MDQLTKDCSSSNMKPGNAFQVPHWDGQTPEIKYNG